MLAAAPTLAQWSNNPGSTTVVASGAGDQGTPQLRLVPSLQASWIEHTDSSAGGIKYRLQQLTATGTRAFTNSLVLSPQRTNTASFVHDLAVNAFGDAVVAYDDAGIWLQRVRADGTFVWNTANPNGVLMPTSSNSLGPQVAAFADGSAVVCYSVSGALNIRRVLADGTLGSSFVVSEAGRSLSPSDILALDDGSFIMLWVRNETTSFLSRKGLQMQKWNASNFPSWNAVAPTNIYTSSAAPVRSIQNGYFPALVSDNEGGAIVAWYDTGDTRNAWLQHVRSDGSLVFADGGLAISTVSAATQLRLSASVAFHPANRGYTVAFQRSNTVQSQFGLSAQRVLSDGTLAWGSGSGIDIVPTGGTQSSFITVLDADGEAIVTWLQYAGANGPMGVLATKLTSAGNPAWTPANLQVATNTTQKGRLSAARMSDQPYVVATWQDGDLGSQDVRAMRFAFDGTLGVPTPTCNSIDFNADGLFPADNDLVDLLSVLAGGACSNDPNCNDIDFNNDGLFPDDNDLIAFLRVLAGGDC
jgi:hypothetical protein